MARAVVAEWEQREKEKRKQRGTNEKNGKKRETNEISSCRGTFRFVSPPNGLSVQTTSNCHHDDRLRSSFLSLQESLLSMAFAFSWKSFGSLSTSRRGTNYSNTWRNKNNKDGLMARVRQRDAHLRINKQRDETNAGRKVQVCRCIWCIFGFLRVGDWLVGMLQYQYWL